MRLRVVIGRSKTDVGRSASVVAVLPSPNPSQEEATQPLSLLKSLQGHHCPFPNNVRLLKADTVSSCCFGIVTVQCGARTTTKRRLAGMTVKSIADFSHLGGPSIVWGLDSGRKHGLHHRNQTGYLTLKTIARTIGENE